LFFEDKKRLLFKEYQFMQIESLYS